MCDICASPFENHSNAIKIYASKIPKYSAVYIKFALMQMLYNDSVVRINFVLMQMLYTDMPYNSVHPILKLFCMN